MKKTILLIILAGFQLSSPAQRSKVLSVFQLIETAKFREAKEIIEEAIVHDKTSQWHKTWFARGLLCQTAHEQGVKENDKKKSELYPDQIYVAYDSYEKALSLDVRGRLNDQIAQQYVLLSNDFQKSGLLHYQRKEYRDAFRAFEHALKITNSPVLTVKVDTGLIYNTALAAFESREWDRAIEYLDRLNKNSHSVNTALLLFNAYIANDDTISAEEVLREGIERYNDNEILVLQLVDLLYNVNEAEEAISILDLASARDTSNYIYPFTKGLLHQKLEQYHEAIKAYEQAVKTAPAEIKNYYHIGICYYNIGVEIEENARSIDSRQAFRAEKERSKEAFENAVIWLEKAHARDQDDPDIIVKLYQLYQYLQKGDEKNSLESKIN
ncbi:MAG TPA: hypothetical protein ENN61_01790 [Bacteroidaceae bacterium]|nr:hypothetical protein [Bacteroidaceae bacterium]